VAGSDWNGWHDALLAAPKLTPNESRLAHALARLLLGWKRVECDFGEQLVRETAGKMHGRSFERARDGLVAKGLLHFSPGSVGKGNRGSYRLILPGEKPALPRVIDAAQKPALPRVNAKSSNARVPDAQIPALPRGRIGSKGSSPRKTAALRAQTPDTNEIRQQAFDAYLSAGGSLSYERERGSLARAVTAEAKTGTETAAIVAACRALGRERAFPGLLKQRVAELAAAGGPCAWEGLDRMALSVAQLSTCACVKCVEWRDYRAAKGES
jgi:hypothetical protein